MTKNYRESIPDVAVAQLEKWGGFKDIDRSSIDNTTDGISSYECIVDVSRYMKNPEHIGIIGRDVDLKRFEAGFDKYLHRWFVPVGNQEDGYWMERGNVLLQEKSEPEVIIEVGLNFITAEYGGSKTKKATHWILTTEKLTDV